MEESYVFTQQITYCLLCGYIGAYKQYNSVYISPKQNYLVLHTFPKMVVGSCCNFYKHRIRLNKQIRTRVSVKESNLGGDLTFQIKISSEVAPLIASQRDESFQEIDRIVKDLEPMISEFQARLGKL